MESGVFLGLDHGGSTTTALVLGSDRQVLASASVPIPKLTPAPGIVEHDPRDFFRTSIEAAGRALDDAALTWHDVRALGIANQGETSMAWRSDSSEPLGMALSWEDRRTSDYCRVLADSGVDRLIRERTGIVLDPYFSASKFHWLAHELPETRAALAAGRLRMGGTDSYVIHRLTGGEVHATDPGTASRTALFNIRTIAWDSDLLDAFAIEEACIPRVRPTCGPFGKISIPEISRSGIDITADVVDAHAALFAQACFDAGSAKATYGTGAFIEVNTGRSPVVADGKMPVFIAWQIGDALDYTLEGGVFSAGSAIDWAVRAGLITSAEETARLAAGVEDTGGVLIVPSFAGLAAPHWVPGAKAMISGLGLDTSNAQIARALLDGIAFACGEVIMTLNNRLGGTLTQIRADGGPSRNPYLMQRQADLLGLPVTVTEEPDMTALGAALLAAIGAGQMTFADIADLPRRRTTFEPRLSADRELEWMRWNRAIRTVRELAQ